MGTISLPLRRWIALSLLCVVLTACSSPSVGTSTPSAATVPTRAVPAPPAPYPSYDPNTAKNTYCINNTANQEFCPTPQNMRDVYGITPLIEKGYTGKGQTVVVIVSFGSPTFSHRASTSDPLQLSIISTICACERNHV